VSAKRHKELHASFDELLACFILANPGKRLSSTTVMEFVVWSGAVVKDPSLCSKHRTITGLALAHQIHNREE